MPPGKTWALRWGAGGTIHELSLPGLCSSLQLSADSLASVAARVVNMVVLCSLAARGD